MSELSFGYTKSNTLFTDIHLSIKKGGICGLLGKNGAGKTTLFKIMAGLIFPSAGNCQVMNETPKHRRPDFLEKIYFLPEELYVPRLTAKQYVKFYAPFYPEFNHTLLANCLHEFELPQDKLLTNLSYGQKKKFLISFGLATASRLFILDEPTNGLDIPSKTQFRKLLASAMTDERLFIISTHQVHDVENLIDSIVVLEEGHIIFQQSLFEVSRRMAFMQQQTEPDPGSCLYYEKHLGGYTTLSINKNDQDTQVDLEILFNAILSNRQNIKQLFSRD